MEELILHGALTVNQGKYQYRILPTDEGWRLVVVEYLNNKKLDKSNGYTSLQDVLQAIQEWIRLHPDK
jgi:hypothetical protein